MRGLIQISLAVLFISLSVSSYATTELALGYGHWVLGNGYTDWNRRSVSFTQQMDGNSRYSLAYADETRFQQTDQSLTLQGVMPLSEGWLLEGEVDRGWSGIFLPYWAVKAGLNKDLGIGWGMHAGWHSASYPASSGGTVGSQTLALFVEKYLAESRWSYRNYQTAYVFPNGVQESAVSHVLSVQYFIQTKESLSLYLSQGTELEYTGGTSPLVIATRGISLVWQRPLTAAWSAHVAADWQQQGTLYTRQGISLEVIRQF